jgi:hypothetical protein
VQSLFRRTSLNFKQVFISCVSKLIFWSSKSIFRSGQYVILQKKILTSKFSYLLFSSPAHKTETGTYYTLLWQVLGSTVPFTSLNKLCKTAGPELFCWAKLAYALPFLHPMLICRVTYWAPVELLYWIFIPPVNGLCLNSCSNKDLKEDWLTDWLMGFLGMNFVGIRTLERWTIVASPEIIGRESKASGTVEGRTKQI